PDEHVHVALNGSLVVDSIRAGPGRTARRLEVTEALQCRLQPLDRFAFSKGVVLVVRYDAARGIPLSARRSGSLSVRQSGNVLVEHVLHHGCDSYSARIEDTPEQTAAVEC